MMLVKRRIHRSIGSIWRSRGRYIVSALCQEEILHTESPVRTSDQYITVLLVILWTQWLLLHRVKVVKIAVPKTVIADDQPPSTSSLRTDITSHGLHPDMTLHDHFIPFRTMKALPSMPFIALTWPKYCLDNCCCQFQGQEIEECSIVYLHRLLHSPRIPDYSP